VHLTWCFAGVVCLTACTAATPSPTLTPTSRPPFPSPTLTPRPSPSSSPTPRPSPTPKVCSIRQLLADTRANLPYSEADITYAAAADRVLTVWYVDPRLDPAAEGQASFDALDNLVQNASMIAIRLNYWAWPCTKELLDNLYIVVVDPDSNAWFSAYTPIEGLPAMAVPSTFSASQVEYMIEYVREGPSSSAAPAPESACSWSEARNGIDRHFGPEERNLGFYQTIDPVGVSVWAQWDESSGLQPLISVAPSLLNLAMELRCLHPRPDQVWIGVVGETGEMILAGVLPGEVLQEDDYASAALEQFKVIGPPELLASPFPGAE